MITFGGRRDLGRLAALGVTVFLAVASVPATTAFAKGDDKPEAEHATKVAKAPAPPKATVNAAACQAAIAALKTLIDQDRAEDTAERQAEKLDTEASEAQNKAADVTEDQAEKALKEAAHAAVETACEPVSTPPSTACATALNALKALNAADKTEDLAERQANKLNEEEHQDNAAAKAEDKTEKAQKDAVHATVRLACGDAAETETEAGSDH